MKKLKGIKKVIIPVMLGIMLVGCGSTGVSSKKVIEPFEVRMEAGEPLIEIDTGDSVSRVDLSEVFYSIYGTIVNEEFARNKEMVNVEDARATRVEILKTASLRFIKNLDELDEAAKEDVLKRFDEAIISKLNYYNVKEFEVIDSKNIKFIVNLECLRINDGMEEVNNVLKKDIVISLIQDKNESIIYMMNRISSILKDLSNITTFKDFDIYAELVDGKWKLTEESKTLLIENLIIPKFIVK